MNLFNIPMNKGIIQTIIIIVIALLILSYFGYNLRSIATSPTAQDNFSYVGEVVSNVWNNWLETPVTYLWNIFVNYIWTPAINILKAGPTTSANQSTSAVSSMLPTPSQVQ